MKKGRSQKLIAKRNRKICERYFYWTEVKRLRFDDAIRYMSENEFFISECVIWKVVRATNTKNMALPVLNRKAKNIKKVMFKGEAEPPDGQKA